MDLPAIPTQEKNLLMRYPRPKSDAFTVWDDFQCYDDEEKAINTITHLGFQCYAVTSEFDSREEAIARMKLKGVAIMRHKRWFKRERDPNDEPLENQ